MKNLPAGVYLKQAGDAEMMGEIFSCSAMRWAPGIMMVYSC